MVSWGDLKLQKKIAIEVYRKYDKQGLFQMQINNITYWEIRTISLNGGIKAHILCENAFSHLSGTINAFYSLGHTNYILCMTDPPIVQNYVRQERFSSDMQYFSSD